MGYVRNGFLVDFLKPWVGAVSGDEWGEWLTALHDAADRGLSISVDEKVEVLVDWIVEELAAADEESWYGPYNYLLPDRAHFVETADDWIQRARSFSGGPEEIDAVIAEIPEFMKIDRPPLPVESDPEYRTYLRLREKFETALKEKRENDDQG